MLFLSSFLFADLVNTSLIIAILLCLCDVEEDNTLDFFDFQIKSEVFLEDLNNVLNAGDVPNIYAPDELDTIYTTMKPIVQDEGLQPTKVNLFMSYTKRVRSNIHMVICMR